VIERSPVPVLVVRERVAGRAVTVRHAGHAFQ
jgi:hypothetical protein